MTRSRRSLWWIVIGALSVALLGVAAFDRRDAPADNQERMFALAGELSCPVCSGQSIAESDVPIAREVRKEIRSRLEQGQTDDQIRDYLSSVFGDDIDLRPRATGLTGVVWIAPVVAFVLAIAGLALVFRRWRTEPVTAATDADRALVDAALATASPGAGQDGDA